MNIKRNIGIESIASFSLLISGRAYLSNREFRS